jgi:energy-coupling factor transporter transmembrane protein EcfT
VFWFIVILMLLFLLLLLIIFTKLTVTIDLKHVGDNDQFKIKFRAWFGLLRYTIDIPFVKVDDDGPNLIVKQGQKVGSEKADNKINEKEEKITPEDILSTLSDIKEIAKHIVDLHKIMRRFLKKIKIKKLEWHSQVGIGDAALTGILTGAAWTIKGSVIGLISQYLKLKTIPVVTITPEFNQFCSRTKLQCIFQFRIGQAMLAGIRFIKYWKGGRPKLKNKPFSFFAN